MNRKRSDRRRGIITAIVWLIIILAGGVLGESLYNVPVKKAADYQYFTKDQTEPEGFELKDGVYVSKKGGASITVRFDEQYVDKFYYEYSYDGQLYATVEAGDYGISNPASKEQQIDDHNNYLYSSSTVNIRRRTDQIKLTMAADVEDVVIRAVAINNTENHSAGRFFFFCIVTLSILLVIRIGRRSSFWKEERVFLFLAMSTGLLMIFALPAHKVGLDEEIHFGRSYYLFETLTGADTVTVTPVMNDLITTSISNWPYSIPQSEEEAKQEENYWNTNLSWNSQDASDEYQQSSYPFHLYSISYLPQALMIKLGQLMHLQFTDIYRMGRLGSLLLYCIVVYFAIRHITWGKRIMFVMALMPTAMFSAVTYTYDVTVTAFTFLGIAYLLPELADDGEKLSQKNAVIFTAAFVLASLPKPVYIPLVGLAWLIPSSRFKSKKTAVMFKGMIAAVILAIIASFALEPLFNANQAGDVRGGDTSVGRQLRYIFAYPVRYAKLLLGCIRKKFFSFTFGYDGLGKMGHLNGNTAMMTTALLSLGTTLTDVRKNSENENKMGMSLIQSCVALVLCFGVLCLVWTAIYLSFTPVGADVIWGVHGRYYLPVTILGLMAVRTGWIENHIPIHLDHAIVTGLTAALLLTSVYSTVLINIF